MTTAEEFLFGAGQSARFENPGDRVSGIVLTEPVMRPQLDYNTKQPKFWDSGEPMEQMVIRLLTQQRADADDDGVRVTYIDSRNKREALRDAVRDAGGKKILVGGFIDQVYTGDGPKSGGGNPPKLYAFQYQQPTQQTLALVEQYHSARAGSPVTAAGQLPQQPPGPGQAGWPPPTSGPGYYPGNVPPQQPQWGPPPQPAQGFPQPQVLAQPFGGTAVAAGTPPVPPPAPQAAQPSWTSEAIAALKQAGVDPRTVYPDYDGRFDQ